MTKEFAHNALADGDFQMTAEERLRYSLDQPQAKNAMTLRGVNAITKARIQYGLAELANSNIENVQRWLERVGEVNPRQAIELFIELAKFSAAQVKAVEVSTTSHEGKPMAQYTLAELQAMAEEANSKVVSHQ